MPNSDAHAELLNYICKEIDQHKWAARWKSGIAQAVVLLAIVTSTLAAVNAATKSDLFGGVVGIVLAAVPGAALLFARTFKYETRAKWHKLKQRKLEAFYRELKFQGADTADVSRRLSTTLERLDSLRTDVGVPDL